MKRAYCKILFIGIVLAALLTGCGGGNREDTAEGGKAAGDSSVQAEAEISTEKDEEEALIQEEASGASQIVFTCQDMDGNVVAETVFSEAKLTMINVWATYCNPCLSEMPGLGELAGEYEPGEFQIIGIISDVMEGADAEPISLAADLIEQTGADYTHLLLNESIYYALLTDVTA
ncbi:MAG: TlpA family protein disulfide reductase, partial [Lachnospiraceae bacterium]|nr:TlpA family protein disulfide reductase [Lachnospiraceae bacterium]